MALARYNDADGSLDTTFGTSSDGTVTTDLGSGWQKTSAVAVESDDSILVAGEMNGHFAVLHYNSDGTQDTSFGGATGGIVTVEFRRHERNALRDGPGRQRLHPRGRHEHADRHREGFRPGPLHCRRHAGHDLRQRRAGDHRLRRGRRRGHAHGDPAADGKILRGRQQRAAGSGGYDSFALARYNTTTAASTPASATAAW